MRRRSARCQLTIAIGQQPGFHFTILIITGLAELHFTMPIIHSSLGHEAQISPLSADNRCQPPRFHFTIAIMWLTGRAEFHFMIPIIYSLIYSLIYSPLGYEVQISPLSADNRCQPAARVPFHDIDNHWTGRAPFHDADNLFTIGL